MSRKDLTIRNRRTVLKAIAGSAVGTAVFTGSAQASGPTAIDAERVSRTTASIEPDRIVEDLSDVGTEACTDCETQYECMPPACHTYDEHLYERECCMCGTDYICEDWQMTTTCCLDS